MGDVSADGVLAPTSNAILTVDESYVPSQTRKPAGNTEVSFDGLLLPPLLLHEDPQEGCGGTLWPAGMALGRYMLRYHRTDLVGKTM